MKYIIKKGKHRARPLSLGIFYNKKVMERDVVFDLSCKYELHGKDNEDVNKLFGIGYFPGHHIDSARFGWNYHSGKIRIYAYAYVNGERVITYLADVILHRRIRLILNVIGDVYSFTVRDAANSWHEYGGADIKFTHNKKLSYKLGCYFGGNNTAPHKIKIQMLKK